MEILFAPIQPFIWAPWRCVAVAGALSVFASVVTHRRGIGLESPGIVTWAAVLAWLLFGVNEYYARKNGWDIRIDLLLGAPLLYLVTLTGVARGIDGLRFDSRVDATDEWAKSNRRFNQLFIPGLAVLPVFGVCAIWLPVPLAAWAALTFALVAYYLLSRRT